MLHNDCPHKQLLTFEILQCYIFPNPLNRQKHLYKLYIEKRIFRPNFMFLGRTVFEKNAMANLQQIQCCTIVLINNFDISDTAMLYFSESSHRLKHCL